MRHRPILIVAAGAVALGAIAIGAVAVGRPAEQSPPPADPHGTTLPATRDVQLSLVMPTPSDFDGLHAKLISGTMPSETTDATVLTDAQCQPDGQGISHCLNRMRLATGAVIAVRHPHDMGKVPCLSPGERVTLVPALA